MKKNNAIRLRLLCHHQDPQVLNDACKIDSSQQDPGLLTYAPLIIEDNNE